MKPTGSRKPGLKRGVLWALALGLPSLVWSCGSPREIVSMVGHELSYSPRPGHEIRAIGANLTDSGMLQICMAVYDTRRDRQGNRPSREYSLEIWPDRLLPPDLRGDLQELSLEGLREVIWKRGERSCSEWNRTRKETVETGWLRIYYHGRRSGRSFALTEAEARADSVRLPQRPERAVFYTVEAPAGGARFLFVGQPTTDSVERRILFTLDGRHIAKVF